VAPVRAELGLRTIFNLVGPLSNPAGAKRQLLGVFAHKWIRPMAETLGRLGSVRAWVVHGSDGLDELTTTGASFVAELKDGRVRAFEVTPEDAGMARAEPAALKGGDAQHNAQALLRVLAGEQSAYRDIVLLNAAAALIVAGQAADLKSGASLAAQSIASGHAAKALESLVAITNGHSP
jgi:anthranilate phosphoribosyltransferase